MQVDITATPSVANTSVFCSGMSYIAASVSIVAPALQPQCATCFYVAMQADLLSKNPHTPIGELWRMIA